MKARILTLAAAILMLSSCSIIIDDEHRIYDDRNKFTGHYQLEEYSDTYHVVAEFSISITKSRLDRDIVYIDNFYGVGVEVLAEVRNNRITIPLQKVNGYEIEGRGWMNHGEIEFDYVVVDLEQYDFVRDYCTATAW